MAQTSQQQRDSESSNLELRERFEQEIEQVSSDLQRLTEAYDTLFGEGSSDQFITTHQSSSRSQGRSAQQIPRSETRSNIQDREIPRNRDGSIDRRTTSGRQIADANVMENFDGMTIDDALDNAPRNQDGTVDLRSKEGRYLKSKNVIDDKGVPFAQRHWKAEDSDFRENSQYR